METYPAPKNEVTAEDILVKLIEKASIYFHIDRDRVIKWAERELSEIRDPEQLKMFRGENDGI